MGPKKDNDRRVKREKTRITLEVKKEIIAKHENGVCVSDLFIQFCMAKSTICTILKNKETIKGASVARGVTVITKQRSQTNEVVEKLLLIWINEKTLAVDSVSEGIICEKARRLHEDLAKKTLVRVLILMFSKLVEGGSKNLRKEVAYIVWLGMGTLRVRTKKLLLRNLCKILVNT
jgi:hypothetical protein